MQWVGMSFMWLPGTRMLSIVCAASLDGSCREKLLIIHTTGGG